jgi:serine/threonine protein kinase
VYLAHDSRLRRNVALKTLPAELAANTDRMRRFEQEATAAAALNHPNLARSPTTSWSRAMGTRRFSISDWRRPCGRTTPRRARPWARSATCRRKQAQGKTSEIDQRSGIFSFGCILFEAVTGRNPFEGASAIKSLHRVVYEPPPPSPISPVCPA